MKSKSIKITLLLFVAFFFKEAVAQEKKIKYVNGKSLSILGQAYPSLKSYHRIDSTDRSLLPKKVQDLALNSSGISINFKTNSKIIDVKWELEKYVVMANMTPIAINGLDLYGFNGKNWQYISSARPSKAENKATFINGLNGEMRAYRVHLPLYSELKNIEIGVEENSDIQVLKEELPERKIAIYGSSITQGTSASRPGMAYPAMLSRKFNVETFNLGFSGNGKMEIEIASILAKIPADIYILDCVPNPSPEQIKERSYPLIKKLRALKPNTPIILVESLMREQGNWDKTLGDKVTQQNAEFKKTYLRLKKEKEKNLYYISSNEIIGDDHEATVDGVHFTDLGYSRIVDALSKRISKALKK